MKNNYLAFQSQNFLNVKVNKLAEILAIFYR